MLLQVHPENPAARHIEQIVEVLRDGGVIILPTDTVYAIGCDIRNARAFERLCRIRGVKPAKAHFSFLFHDLSTLAEYTRPFNRSVFKLLKATLPGPFTYILSAGGAVPSIFRNNKKTIGIRVPNHPIPAAIIQELGYPLLSASLKDEEDSISEYLSDPTEIHDRYEKLVDLVIDGGFGHKIPSTVVDCTGDEPVLIRQGLGNLP